MAVDTPAKIAILGAGPVGLEAALYARYLGYDVVIYEQGEAVAASVNRWGHARMFSPFGMNSSPLGLAAIRCQDEAYRPPAADALLTGREWVDRYLLPLSQTDLLADHVRLGAGVVRVGRPELHKADLAGDPDRGDWPFRILLRDAAGQESFALADVVVDCTGVFAAPPPWLGHGGIPAIGEMSLRASQPPLIELRLPDILGSDRAQYAGQRILLIGGGYSAATNALALAQVAREVPATRVTWLTRREAPAGSGGPLPLIPSDPLPERDRLARAANRLASDANSGIVHWPLTVVEKLTRGAAGSAMEVELSGEHAGTFTFDRIIANVGFQPDRAIYEELQVHECYATHAPLKIAAGLAPSSSTDCLDQAAGGGQALLNPEPNFYILGAKSYGRDSRFLFSAGLEQIRELFTILGERETLDLYASAKQLIADHS